MAKSEFEKALEKTQEIKITVKGRKSGKSITLPIWFVHEPGKLQLLPVTGSRTNWYRNLRKHSNIQVQAENSKYDGKARLIEDKKKTKEIANKFGKKHGAGDLKKYYSVFDVSVEVPIV
jgi:deazaflavin-dependent oxidoreductase (nitroreductase family)